MDNDMKSELNTRMCVLLIIFAVFGIYYPAIFLPLNSVDDSGMYNYLLNTDEFSFRSIFTPGGMYYRPVIIVSFMLDKYVWGLEESFMHLENIIFHLLNTLLVFAVARKSALLQGIRSELVPLVAAVFFAVHPINTEAVNWISGRTDLLACFFLLLSVFLLLRKSPGRALTFLAALSMLVACFAKETAIFLLPAAMLLPFFQKVDGFEPPPIRLTIQKNLSHFILFSTAGIGYFAFRTLGFNRGDVGVSRVITHVAGDQSAGLLISLRLFFKAAGFYLKKLFLPFPLNFGIIHVSDFYLPVGVFVAFLVLWLLTRRTLTSFFFICAAAIGSSALIIPLLRLAWTPLGERYMYIPSAFFVIGLTFTIYQWEKRKQYQTIFSLGIFLVAIIAVYGTVNRTILWQDNLALFQDTQRKSPDFIPAQNQIGVEFYKLGKAKESAAVIMSMKISDDLINSQYALLSKSSVLANKGDLEGAKELLNLALENPGKHEILICQGLLDIYELEGKAGTSVQAKLYPDKVRLLSRLYILSGNPFDQYRLGQVYMHHNELKLAKAAFSLAASKAPPIAYYRLPALKLAEKL
jgi:protein O-mannosyl-transferase